MSHPCHARRPLALVLLLPFVLVACGDGGADLTANDMQVCYYAHDSDAERIYEHADEADSDEIVDLASVIEAGSSDANDESAMRKITEFCEDNGYDYAKDGRYGRDDDRTKEDQAASEDATVEPSESMEPSPTEPAVALPTELWGNGRQPGEIEKADLGEHWPFTTDEGRLHCVDGGTVDGSLLYLEAGGYWWLLTENSIGDDDWARVSVTKPPDPVGVDAVESVMYDDNGGGLCVDHQEDDDAVVRPPSSATLRP